MFKDNRVPLEEGAEIWLRKGQEGREVKYIVETLLGSGGTALLYQVSNDLGDRFCLKEYFPLKAIRKSDMTIGLSDGWKQRILASQDLARTFRAETSQALFAPLDWDYDKQMVEILPLSPKNCHTLANLLEAWDKNCIPPLQRLKTALSVIKSLLWGLDKLHQQNIAHCDLSAGNIFWENGPEGMGQTYLLDFSSSCQIGEPVHTHSGYSHPLFQEGSKASKQVDLYSVSALLTVLVSGQEGCSHGFIPYDLTNARNIQFILKKIALPPSITWKLRSIITRGTSLFEQEQFKSADEFLDEISKLEEIVYCNGVHPEVVAQFSQATFTFEKHYGSFHYDLDVGLLPQVDWDLELTKNTLLIGGAGSGKSTFLLALWGKYLLRYRSSEDAVIPIYIPLYGFHAGLSNWNYYIQDYIAHVYLKVNQNDSTRRGELMDMLRSGKNFLLMLDGLDEASQPTMLKYEIDQLAKIPGVTILVTSRSEVAWLSGFSTVKMMPLCVETVLEKLDDAGLPVPDERLLKLIMNPMLLSIYLNVGAAGEISNAGQLLFRLHQHLLKTHSSDSEDAKLRGIVLSSTLPQVALILKRRQFSYEELKSILFKQLQLTLSEEDTFNSLPDEARTKKVLDILLHAGLIYSVRGDGEQYIFAHSSYLYFYKALCIDAMLSQKNFAPLAHRWQHETVSYLADLAGIEQLQKCLELFAYDTSEIARKMVRNLMECMKFLKKNDFNGGFAFDGLDLSESNLKDCLITKASFRYAQLSEKTFSSRRHQNKPSHLLLATNGIMVTVAENEDSFIVWQPDGEVLYRKNVGFPIELIDLSPGGETIAIYHPDEGHVLFFEACSGNLKGKISLRPTQDVFWKFVLSSGTSVKTSPSILRFGPECKTIISDAYCHGCKSWNIESGLSQFTFALEPMPGEIQSRFAISGNRKWLLILHLFKESERKYGISIWDTSTGTCVKALFKKTPRWPHAISLSPDGFEAALVFNDGAVELLRWRSKQTELFGYQKNPRVPVLLAEHHLFFDSCFIDRGTGETHYVPEEVRWFASDDGNRVALLLEDSSLLFDEEMQPVGSTQVSDHRPFVSKKSITSFFVGNTIGRITSDGKVELLNLENERYTKLFSSSGTLPIGSPFFNKLKAKNGPYLLERDSESSRVRIWKLDENIVIGTVFLYTDFVSDAYVFEKNLLVVSTVAKTLRKIAIYDFQNNTHIDITPPISRDAVLNPRILRSEGCLWRIIGEKILFVTTDGKIQVWDLTGSLCAEMSLSEGKILNVVPVINTSFVLINAEFGLLFFNMETYEFCYGTISEEKSSPDWLQESGLGLPLVTVESKSASDRVEDDDGLYSLLVETDDFGPFRWWSTGFSDWDRNAKVAVRSNFAVIYTDREIDIFNLSGRLLRSIHLGARSVDISANGEWIAASQEGSSTVHLYNISHSEKDFVWNCIDDMEVEGLDVRHAVMDDSLRRTLRQNGSIV